MEFMDIMQTTSALSGLVCLMMVLFFVKKRLKAYR